ncbi:MAG: hypothetical protein IJ390_12485 [Lachnospiraceae bacterium]|nr:hypothetical protein [Lachnospiraceae bacterium]
MYYSVCISAVFGGKTIEEALAAVRTAGFDYYEFWGWQGLDAAKGLKILQEQLQQI